jgi:hypothetical protein
MDALFRHNEDRRRKRCPIKSGALLFQALRIAFYKAGVEANDVSVFISARVDDEINAVRFVYRGQLCA